MPRFFTDDIDGAARRAVLHGEDARHVSRVLRLKIGDELCICDGAGTDYACRVTEIARDDVFTEITAHAPSEGEPTVKVSMLTALPKADKLELVIQKCVELGAWRIIPFISKRCVSRPDRLSTDAKLARWRRISLEAAKQCGRGTIPEVCNIMEFHEAVQYAAMRHGAVLYEKENKYGLKTYLKECMSQGLPEIAFMVGCEGGFSEEEHMSACENGLASVTLGKRILRCETAPIAVLTAAMYEAGEM